MTIEVGAPAINGFATGSITQGSIASGATGEILSIPAVAGKRHKITMLFAQTGIITGITVTCGTRAVISSGNLEDDTAAATSFANNFAVSVSGERTVNIPEILTLPGEGITINAGAAISSNITYAVITEA